MYARLIPFFLLVTLLFALALPAQAAPARLPALAPNLSDGYALIDAVNQLRAASGLPAYQTSAALMISAQLHSQYQASIGTWSHEGVDGTDETQRAAIQGYGSGASIACDEAVGFGIYTAQQMVDAWNEPTHLPIMISSRYIHVGAGAAVDAGGRIFYTLDVCLISGEIASVFSSSADITQEVVYEYATATPQPDGSIIHEVEAGESFFSVADDYELTVDELLSLNNLTSDAMLSPGDLLLVRLAFTPSPSPEPSLTPTPIIPTATRRPTRTPTVAIPSNTPLPSPTPTPRPWITLPNTAALMGRGLPTLAALLGAAGIVLVIAGSVLKRRR